MHYEIYTSYLINHPILKSFHGDIPSVFHILIEQYSFFFYISFSIHTSNLDVSV